MKHTVTQIELEAGTKGLFIDVPSSEVVCIRIPFRAGYQFGTFDKFEIPHLIEHHILNASKKYPKNNALLTEINRNGASSNASTDPFMITYIVNCAAFEVERVLELLGEIITEPLFPPSMYETERENVRTELTRKLTDWGIQIQMISDELNYPQLVMNYDRRIKQLDSITHNDVVEYYRSSHTAENGSFILAGDVSSHRETIETSLNKIFSALPTGSQNTFWDDRGKGIEKPLLVKKDIEAVYFNLNWFAGELNDKDRPTSHLMRSILTGGFSSRIYGKARDIGLTYHISSGLDTTKKASSYGFNGFCNSEQWQPLLELIVSEMEIFLRDGPTQTEVDDARERTKGRILLGRQTAGSLLGWYAGDYLMHDSLMSYDEYFELIDAVTPDDITRIVNHYMATDRHSLVLLGGVDGLSADQIETTLKPIWH